jgi:hypothetical protein
LELSEFAHGPAIRVGVAYLEQYFEDAVECLLREKISHRHQRRIPMEMILIIVLVVLLFGGGGYWGRSRGHW